MASEQTIAMTADQFASIIASAVAQGVAAALACKAEAKSAGAERQARYRERHKASQSVTSDAKVTVSDAIPPLPPFPPSPPSPVPPSPTPTHTPPPTPDALACEDEPKSPPTWKPTTEQLRVASWFGRRETTRWSDKELKSWRAIAASIDTSDLDLLELRYMSNDPETVKYRRHDLATLLNNWPGEVDKARRWTPPQVSNVSAKNSTDETPWFEKPELPLNP